MLKSAYPLISLEQIGAHIQAHNWRALCRVDIEAYAKNLAKKPRARPDTQSHIARALWEKVKSRQSHVKRVWSKAYSRLRSINHPMAPVFRALSLKIVFFKKTSLKQENFWSRLYVQSFSLRQSDLQLVET